MTEYNPKDDPDDYEVDPSEPGGPNDDIQDPDVPDATFEEGDDE